MNEKISVPTIRQATTEDLEAILGLVKLLALYEKAPEKVTVTLAKYQEAFSEGCFSAFVAESGGKIVGMALYYMTFSTWKGKMLYLEDFYVLEEYRGQGIGKVLFERYIDEARSLGCSMCKWQVLDWNTPAIDFYRKYDVVMDTEWIDVKVYF